MNNFILIVFSIFLFLIMYVCCIKKSNSYELFEDIEETVEPIKPILDLNKLKYGYMNTNYQEIMKQPMKLLREPLPLQKIPYPPENTSLIAQKECKFLYDISMFGEKQKKKIVLLRKRFSELDKEPLEVFTEYCKENNLKINNVILKNLDKDIDILALKLKDIYNRPRPYQLCYIYGYPLQYFKSTFSDSASYPSRMSLKSYIYSYILGMKYQKNQKELEKMANDISWSRVYSGNNYESDIECSKFIVFHLRGYLESIEI